MLSPRLCAALLLPVELCVEVHALKEMQEGPHSLCLLQAASAVAYLHSLNVCHG